MWAFDTNIFIYALDNHPQFGAQARALIRKVNQGRDQAVASVLVLTEFMRFAEPAMLHALEQTKNLQFKSVDRSIALSAAALLKRHPKKLRPFDAIHLATALQGGATAFWTNDVLLAKLDIRHLKIRLIDEMELI